MAKQNKLEAALKKRNPLEERQIITPVDVLATEQANALPERENRTVTPNAKIVRKKRTGKANVQSEQTSRTVLDELQEGTAADTKRQTERYSFEIYTDQKGSIEELQYLYKKRTGKKLSSSRIIREALADYLDR